MTETDGPARHGPYVALPGGTTHPVDPEVGWQLRYAPEAAMDRRFYAASVVDAYFHLVDPTISRTDAIAALKRARLAQKVAHDRAAEVRP